MKSIPFIAFLIKLIHRKWNILIIEYNYVQVNILWL